MEKISITKQETYEDLSKYLIDKIDMNNIQIYSYNDFICNKIRRYMSRVYNKGLFEVRFLKWWIDDSNTIPVNVCKSKHVSHEVALKALMEITFTKDFSDRKLNLPSSSTTVEVEVTKFPQLTKNGNFVINGVDKILISHLERADKIFLRSPDPKDAKQKGQLELITRNGKSLSMSKFITFKNVGVNMEARSHTMSFMKVLGELGYIDEESIFSVVGVNNFFLSKMNDSTLSLGEDKSARLIDILRNFEIGIEDRQGMNKRLSFIRNITGKVLAKDVSFTYKGEAITYKRLHKVTRGEAKKMQESGITSVEILEKGSTVPVLNNGFVDSKEAFSSYGIPIPQAFLVKSRNPLNSKRFMEYYLACNKVELDELYAKYGSDKELFQSQVELNIGKLIGSTLCKNDLLAMLNLFSRSLLHLEEYDDIDSLENKKIVNISDIFEKGLAEAIGVPSKYNTNKIPSNSLLSRIEAEVKRIKNSTTEVESALDMMLRFDFKSILNQQYTITSATSKNPLFSIEDSTNPLAQINHKRRITLQYVQDFGGIQSMSPDPTARQNNPSFSGRIDCVETPEGQSVGLVRQYGALSYLNEFGQIEAPYLRVDHEKQEIDLSCVYYMTYDEELVFNRVLSPRIASRTGVAVEYLHNGELVDTEFYETGAPVQNLKPYEKLAKQKMRKLGATEYRLEKHKKNWFIDSHLTIIKGHGNTFIDTPDKVEFISCSGEHIFSPVTAAIPFIEFDDAARGMMGSVMSKQAIPVYGKQMQYVRTKMAHAITPNATGVITAPYNLTVLEVDAKRIKVKNFHTGEEEYIDCLRQDKTSKKTLNKSIPIVKVGDFCLEGDVIADSTSTYNGELAHGTHLKVAIMAYEGDNYEDAVIFSERLVKNDAYTSIHLEYYELHLGKDQIVSNKSNLYNHKDDKGNSYICSSSLECLKSNRYSNTATIEKWTQVKPNDILACKIVKKDKKGDRANSSAAAQEYVVVPLKYSGNVPGTVVDVDVYEVNKDEICYLIKIAYKEKVGVGDKYTGRHGNKGIICSIYPEEDMPYDEKTGDRPDIVINLLGIPSRMNIGQEFDGQLGTICHDIGMRANVKTLSNINVDAFKKAIALADADKHQLCDGKTGKRFRYATLVTLPYTEKLEHRVGKKIHARSSKPYTTRRQPTQGKAQNGGQRLGEMEFWSLMALGAFNICREFMMYKTDDVDNRYAFLDMMESNEEPDWSSVVERKQNVSYAFLRTDVYCKSMFRRIQYWDKDGNEIDITGSANKVKAGAGRSMVENLNKAKKDLKDNISTSKQISVLDIVEEEDDDYDISLGQASSSMAVNTSSDQSQQSTNFVYIPVDDRKQNNYNDLSGNLEDDLEDGDDEDSFKADKGDKLIEDKDYDDEPTDEDEDSEGENAF